MSGSSSQRPLSPHLQIYKPIFTMVMSIVHRITGSGLYFGMALLSWWLIAAASGEDYFNFVNGIFGSIIGLIVLFGFTWALLHHALGGVRHFIWDMGKGFDRDARENLARFTLIGSVVLTLIIWILALVF